MKILIFEGMSTSGKSSVIALMKELYKDMDILIVDETETHMPVKLMVDELHIRFFEDLVNRQIAKAPAVLVFDRLYLTQAFRVGATLKQYAAIESLLLEYKVRTIFLKVRPAAIADRLARSLAQRDQSWEAYVHSKGSNLNEIANYYYSQQQKLTSLLATSKVPYSVFDTTESNYTEITEQIAHELEAM